MKITLFLYFPQTQVLLKRTWDLTVSTGYTSNPFIINIPVHKAEDQTGQNGYFPTLNYPHTGDTHLLKDYPLPQHDISFISRQTYTSEITIWGEVLNICHEGSVFLGWDEQIIETLLNRCGWIQASEAEKDSYRRFLNATEIDC